MDIRPKIIYVDDEQINLTLFQLTFRRSFDVLIANSGQEGLELIAQNEDIRFVISDMKMPGMDGLEFIQKVKEINNLLPCILLSGYDRNDRIDSALESDLIKDYVMKPFNKDELHQILDKYI